MSRLKQDCEEADEELETAQTQIDTLQHQVAQLEGTAILSDKTLHKNFFIIIVFIYFICLLTKSRPCFEMPHFFITRIISFIIIKYN